MANQRLKKQMEFLREIDKEKNVIRKIQLTHNGRLENDAEHSWHMAIMTYLLSEYVDDSIDVSKAIMMSLIHDIGEIYSGDAYAFDEEGLKIQSERELPAVEKVFSFLPENQRKTMLNLYLEYKKGESIEAQFVHDIDNLQAILLIEDNDGKNWKNNGISRQQVEDKFVPTKSNILLFDEYVEEIINRVFGDNNL